MGKRLSLYKHLLRRTEKSSARASKEQHIAKEGWVDIGKKGVLRNHQKVIVPGIGEGEITSDGFSPTLQCAIALAGVPVLTKNQCFVEMRGQLCQAQVVKPKFVHFGKKVIA